MPSPRGFTLVEMLLVILLLGSLALVATVFVDNANEQFRFEQTKSALEQIRHAIIGNSVRSLNGQPDISGFVVDMGRLPANLSELLEPGTQAAWQSDMLSLEDGSISGVALDVQLSGGWRGPYVDVLPASNGAGRTFRDGWGNIDPVDADDALNFGWRYSSLSGVISMQSYGADGAPGAIDPENSYQQDYPATGQNLVDLHDYQLAAGLMVKFSQSPVPGTALFIRLYRMRDGILNGDIESDSFTTLSGVKAYPTAFPADAYPIGTYAAVMLCDDMNQRVFDGDCSGNSLHTFPYYFTLAPRAQLPAIKWNIQ